MRLILLLLLSVFVLPIFSAETEDATPQFDERILEDPNFKEYVVKCEKEASAATSADDHMATCINQAFRDLKTSSPELIEELKEKYVTAKKEEKSTNKKPKKLTNYQHIVPKAFSKKTIRSPQFKALTKYLTDRLQEAMYGKQKDSKKIIDHGAYYELYTNQISKNIILNLSSFCLDARYKKARYVDDKGVTQTGNLFFLVKADQSDANLSVRNANIASLSSFQTDSQGNKHNVAKGMWEQCISQISRLCIDPTGEPDDTHAQKIFGDTATATTNMPSPSPPLPAFPPTNASDDKEYTQQRACMVSHILKEQKLVLSTTEDIKDSLKAQLNKSNIANADVNYDELTTVTSGEMKKNYGDKTQELLDEVEECKMTPDAPNCKKILEQFVGQKDNLNKGRGEYEILSASRNEKLKEDLLDDKKSLEVIATENNLDEKGSAKIGALEESEIDSIKRNIELSYQKEAEAIKAQITTRITEANKSSQDQLGNIHTDLTNSIKNKNALMHYNNIVSGYLTATEKGKKDSKSNNLQVIKRELDDNAYASDRAPAAGTTVSPDQQRLKEIEINTEMSAINKDKKNSNSYLDVDTINKELLLFNKKDKKED